MGKQDIFSKIQIVDYNNMLEHVLEAKDFSESVKNLLLNMLYNIENGYEDYKTVKINASSKKYFVKKIIEIVQNECNKIELVSAMSEESKELEQLNVNYIVNKEEKSIKVYQNPKMLLEALVCLNQKEITLNKKYELYESSIKSILEKGNAISNSEVLRDFNGFSWGITPTQIENKNINIVYQNLLILFGNMFMEKWISDNEEIEEIDIPNNEILRSKYNSNFGLTKEEILKDSKVDYIKEMKNILEQKSGKENAKEFLGILMKTILILNCNIDKKQKEMVLLEQEKIEIELKKMQNNKKYLEEISERKKDINIKIKEIDTLLSNDVLLKEEYYRRNEKLPNKEKIFSVSHLVIMLEKERKKYLEQIKEYNKKMEPQEFVKYKEKLQKKQKFHKDLELNKDLKSDETKQIELLQKSFLKCIQIILENTNEKDEIEKLLYEIRYYCHIPYKQENLSKMNEINGLILETIKKEIIEKACKEKLITTFSNNKELNYKILKNLFDSKIINLSNTIYELKYHKGILKIQVFDTTIEDETIEIEIEEKVELNVKLNKKIKVVE